MTEEDFKRKTKLLAISALRLADTLPRRISADVVSRQIVRAATSVGANYRASCRAKSRADMIAKLGIVEEEADEVLYWIEIGIEGGVLIPEAVAEMRSEAEEILRMTVASRKTLRRRTE